MKRWCIVNINSLREAEVKDREPIGCEILPLDFAPSVFYGDQDRAEKELMRLAEKHPGEEFTLFESVAHTVESRTRGLGPKSVGRVIHLDPILC